MSEIKEQIESAFEEAKKDHLEQSLASDTPFNFSDFESSLEERGYSVEISEESCFSSNDNAAENDPTINAKKVHYLVEGRDTGYEVEIFARGGYDWERGATIKNIEEV